MDARLREHDVQVSLPTVPGHAPQYSVQTVSDHTLSSADTMQSDSNQKISGKTGAIQNSFPRLLSTSSEFTRLPIFPHAFRM